MHYPRKTLGIKLLSYSKFFLVSSYNQIQVDSVYMDFSKVFDNIRRYLLFPRLPVSGVAGNLLQWIMPYISNRSEHVTFKSISVILFNGINSSTYPCTCGVPQGSDLGPLF